MNHIKTGVILLSKEYEIKTLRNSIVSCMCTNKS